MQVAIITGGSRGLGQALSTALVERGWEVIIDGRDAGALAEAARAVGAPPRLHVVPGDIDDDTHLDELVEVASGLGRLDLLVANAGTLGPTPLPRLEDLDRRAFERALRTNVAAQVALVQKALPLLRGSEGTVVTISSDAGVEHYEGWGAYGATKAALDLVAGVLGVEEPSLRVYAFDPGDMRTQMHQDAFPGDDISDRPLPEAVVPVLLRLLDERPRSGRYRAAELAEVVS